MFELIECFNILATGGEIALALIIAGGVTSTVAAVQSGRAARAKGEAAEKIAQRNAQLAERQAEEEQTAAAAEALRIERQGKALKSKQRTLFAKAGVEARGTPLSVIVETAQNIEADRLTILREGQIRRGTSIAQAGIFRAQGKSAKARGKATQRASVLSAVGTSLSTVGQAKLAQSKFKSGSTGRGTVAKSQTGGRRIH